MAEVQAELVAVPDWATELIRRKYRMVGHISRRDDGRWATKVLYWILIGGTRRRGRPEQRWTDYVDKLFGTMFEARPCVSREVAEDRTGWKSYEDELVLFLRA